MGENHKVPVIRIEEIRKHPNADTLELIDVGGYQVVVKAENYKVGDLAVYIPPDSVVPQTEAFRFIWGPFQCEPDGQAPAKRRRITVRRFRKEWSEGLLMPISDFPELIINQYGEVKQYWPEEGSDVAETLGIIHYAPPEDLSGENESAPSSQQSKRFPRSPRGWFYFLIRFLSFGYFNLNGKTGGASEKAPEDTPPVYDVDSFKNHTDVLQPGELVIITEKIHGSNARYTLRTGALGDKLFAGSKNLWKSITSKCVWRRILEQDPWVKSWLQEHPGYTLYGEAIPTQGAFNYGVEGDNVKVLFFDVRTPEGTWAPYVEDVDGFHPPMGIPYEKWVPILAVKPFDLNDIKQNFVDGASTVRGAKHIREGIVIRPVVEREAYHLGRVQLKIVSNNFLFKDSEK
jgi:tRNA-binding EMAP/Myf-like protein